MSKTSYAEYTPTAGDKCGVVSISELPRLTSLGGLMRDPIESIEAFPNDRYVKIEHRDDVECKA